jgi:hypothetical protein
VAKLAGARSREAVIKDLRIAVLQRVQDHPEGPTTPGMGRWRAAPGAHRVWAQWVVSRRVVEVYS